MKTALVVLGMVSAVFALFLSAMRPGQLTNAAGGACGFAVLSGLCFVATAILHTGRGGDKEGK